MPPLSRHRALETNGHSHPRLISQRINGQPPLHPLSPTIVGHNHHQHPCQCSSSNINNSNNNTPMVDLTSMPLCSPIPSHPPLQLRCISLPKISLRRRMKLPPRIHSPCLPLLSRHPGLHTVSHSSSSQLQCRIMIPFILSLLLRNLPPQTPPPLRTMEGRMST